VTAALTLGGRGALARGAAAGAPLFLGGTFWTAVAASGVLPALFSLLALTRFFISQKNKPLEKKRAFLVFTAAGP
jgi:hypothetical protein